jgi:hypothetical protein
VSTTALAAVIVDRRLTARWGALLGAVGQEFGLRVVPATKVFGAPVGLALEGDLDGLLLRMARGRKTRHGPQMVWVEISGGLLPVTVVPGDGEQTPDSLDGSNGFLRVTEGRVQLESRLTAAGRKLLYSGVIERRWSLTSGRLMCPLIPTLWDIDELGELLRGAVELAGQLRG